MAEDRNDEDLSVVAWKVGVTYEVFGGKRRGSATGQSESNAIRRLLNRDRQIGAVRKVEALKDISFVARRGESIGIIGHNGSGKSTLLRAIAGLVPPTDGHVWLSGQPSLLGVNAVLLPKLSGERNVYIGGQALGLTIEQIDERFDDIVALADIGDAIDRPMSTYSSGQGARLRFAISTAARPEILMIDEALATGDAAFRERSKDKMAEMLDNAGTLFLVSHSNATIVNMCKRALWIDHGRLVMDGPSDEVIDSYARGKVPRKRTTATAPVPAGSPPRALPIPDEPEAPLIQAIVWGRTCPLFESANDEKLDEPATAAPDLLSSIVSGGVVNLMVSPGETAEDDRELLRSAGVTDFMIQAETSDEPLAVAIPRVLQGLALPPERVLLVDSDPGTLSAVAMTVPGIQVLDAAEPDSRGYLERFARRIEGTAPNLTDSFQVNVLGRNAAGWASPDGNPHNLQFTVLEDLQALHLADELDHLVNTASKLNYTSSRFAAGQGRRMIGDLRRNRVFVVVAWDDFGMHGVVGLVTMRRGRSSLEDFVFADRMRGTGLVDAVVEHMRDRFRLTRTEFPVEPADVDAEPRLPREVRALLVENGLGASESPDLRIFAGLDSASVALATGMESLFAADRAAFQSLRASVAGDFKPGARVLGYWAGRDYDDGVWGEGPAGLEEYRLAVEQFVQRCAGTRLLVALPQEEVVTPQDKLPTARLIEYNQIWRDALESVDGAEAMEIEPDESDAARISGAGTAAFALRLVQLTSGSSRLPVPPASPSPQHLELRGHFEGVGRLGAAPVDLPIAWEGVRARTWEIEVTASTEHLDRSGALIMIDATAPKAVRTGRDGVAPFSGTGAPLYRYLDTSLPRTVTRFVIEAKSPVTPTKLALRSWGGHDLGVVVDSVRIWTHRQ